MGKSKKKSLLSYFTQGTFGGSAVKSAFALFLAHTAAVVYKCALTQKGVQGSPCHNPIGSPIVVLCYYLWQGREAAGTRASVSRGPRRSDELTARKKSKEICKKVLTSGLK